MSGLSWTGFSRAFEPGFTIEALLGGAVVSSLVFGTSNTFENGIVLFTDSTFDEIRFAENTAFAAFFALDKLSWNVLSSSIPAPGILSRPAAGLSGSGMARRKQAQALDVAARNPAWVGFSVARVVLAHRLRVEPSRFIGAANCLVPALKGAPPLARPGPTAAAMKKAAKWQPFSFLVAAWWFNPALVV